MDIKYMIIIIKYTMIIKDYLKYCHKKMIYKKDEEFIDGFINLTDKINYIIYYLQRLFISLDRFFTRLPEDVHYVVHQ